MQCALDGAQSLHICNRRQGVSFERALETVEKIREAVPDCETAVFDLEDEERMAREIGECDIFVNATSIGMAPGEKESVVKDPKVFRPGLVVADIVYNPLETRFCGRRRKRAVPALR